MRMGAPLIIIRYCCGKQCELLLNRFLIKDLHHKLNLLCHLPLSSIIRDKIRPPPSFSTPCGKNFDPPTSSLDPPVPPPTKNLDPHLHFGNSITDHIGYRAKCFSAQSSLQLLLYKFLITMTITKLTMFTDIRSHEHRYLYICYKL